jgi:hypothetical protein
LGLPNGWRIGSAVMAAIGLNAKKASAVLWDFKVGEAVFDSLDRSDLTNNRTLAASWQLEPRSGAPRRATGRQIIARQRDQPLAT